MANVCSLWRQRCNKYLFQQVQIKPSSVLAFKTLLSLPFSRESILRHINHLWIGGHDTREGEWDAIRVEVLQDLLINLRKAHHLTNLTLLKSVSDLFEVGFITFLPLHLSRIQSLHLADVHFSNSGEFAGFFNGFSMVQYVVLKDVTVPSTYSPPTAMIRVERSVSSSAQSNSRFILSLHFDDDGSVRRCLRWKPSHRGMRISLRDVAVLHCCSSSGPIRSGASVSVGPDVSHIEILAKQCHGCEYIYLPPSDTGKNISPSYRNHRRALAVPYRSNRHIVCLLTTLHHRRLVSLCPLASHMGSCASQASPLICESQRNQDRFCLVETVRPRPAIHKVAFKHHPTFRSKAI